MGLCREYGLEVVIMRFFNTVGPRQTGRYGMVIPSFIRQAIRNEPITVYGDGTQSRCFCDARDVVKALIGLAYHPNASGQVYNIGSTEEVTIKELAERVIKITKSNSDITYIPYDQAYAPGFEDMRRRVPDLNRITSLLDWAPQRTLDDILESVTRYEVGRLDNDE
jgi:UDP-glucose 4-epimerase